MSTKDMEKSLFAIFSAVHYFAENNVSRQKGTFFDDKDDLIDLSSKLIPGWREVLGVPIVYALSKEQIETAIAQREKQWNDLKTSKEEYVFKYLDTTYNVGYNDVLITFQNMYTKDGKVIAPKFGGVFGYRRNAAVLYANAVRAKAGMSAIEGMTCVIKHYEKLDETYEDCVAENTLKNEGVKVLNWKDMITSAKALYEARKNENTFRNLYKAGTGQKLFKFITLNAKHPKLDLFGLAMRDEINVSSMDKEELADAIKEGWAETDVLDYVKNPKGDKDVPVKMASRKDIQLVLERCPIEIAAYFAQCFLTNNLAGIDAMNAKADAINKATHGMFKLNREVFAKKDEKTPEPIRESVGATVK